MVGLALTLGNVCFMIPKVAEEDLEEEEVEDVQDREDDGHAEDEDGQD